MTDHGRPKAGAARPLRLGILAYPYCVGGVEHFISRLLTHLDATRVIPFVVFLLDGPTARYFKRRHDHVDVLSRRTVPLTALRVWLARHRIDLLMTTMYDTVGGQACRLENILHVWRCGGKLDVAGAALPGRSKEHLFAWMTRLADAVIVNSRTVAADFTSRGAQDVVLIPNGIAPSSTLPRSRLDLRRRFRWAERDPLVFMIGHLWPVKRHLDFIRAAVLIRKAVPGCRFVLFGDVPSGARPWIGRYVEQLRARCEEAGLDRDLRFVHGETDAARFLPQAQVLVHPCGKESFPNAVLEAMAAGLPIVAARGGGNVELIDHDRTGVLVPPCAPRHLAEAVVALLQDPARARRLGDAARTRARTSYDIRVIASRYEEVLRTIASPALTSGRPGKQHREVAMDGGLENRMAIERQPRMAVQGAIDPACAELKGHRQP